MDPGVYLHLATPLVLLAPVLRLSTSPPDPPAELPGIRPVTVRIVTPRRPFILLTLFLLAISSTLDAARVITQIALSNTLELTYGTWAEVGYAFGGLCVWALAAIFIEWRARWGDRGLVVLGLLGIALEIPNLVLAVLKQIHGTWSSMIRADADPDIFHILAIPTPALRLLLLPLLVILVLLPNIRYQPAEITSLLSAATPTSTDDYGTVKIPKKLGQVKKEEKPLTWREIWNRLVKLSPRLWPSTSKKLQLCVIACVGCMLLGRFASPLSPIILGRLVNQLVAAQNGLPAHPLVPFVEYIGIRLCLGGSGLVSIINNILWVPIMQYTDREMQMLCFNHLLNLSLAYHTKRNTGEVLKIIDRGSSINDLFHTVLFTAIPTVLDIIIGFGVFYYLFGPLLALVTFAVMSLYVLFSVTSTNRRMRLRRIMVDKDVKSRGIASDVLTNWESVKYFTAEQRESHRFLESVVSYQETQYRFQIGFNLLFLVQFFILTLGLALGALIVAFRVINGQADAASFVVFTQYYAQLQSPFSNFGSLYRSFNSQTNDAEKMFALLNEKTEVNDKPDAKELVVTDGVIEFQNVTFSYDGKIDALRGVSFRLGKGESLALVGESGSGKSTILRLLYRFYDIKSGRILIDGQDISQVTQLSLRRAIGIVPQDSVLWNDTIGANISYGKEGSSDDEIIAAAKAARLHDRIMGFPEQYETVVGERGVRLSGGEKQRVSLARMFLKSPAILVLDEATSALDTETEREIQKALAELAQDRSSLSIAHRLSTIINSDQIVVMKDGQVIEIGGYKELLERDGVFATMWKKQIFTDAEILAQSGMNSGAASASGTRPASVKSAKPARLGQTTQDTVESNEASSLAVDHGVVSTDESTPAEARENLGVIDTGAVPLEGVSAEAPEIKASDEDLVDLTEPQAAESVPAETEPLSTEPDSYAAAVKDTLESNESDPVTTEQPSGKPEAAHAPSSSPSEARPSPSRSTSSYRVSFPPIPRMSSSTSQRSNLSGASGDIDGPSTPGAASEAGDGSGDKRRKRLSSLKGFVRRISDQGVSRSNSLRSMVAGSPKSPIVQLGEGQALLSPGAANGGDQVSASPLGGSVSASTPASGSGKGPASVDLPAGQVQAQGKKKKKGKGRK